MSLKPGMRAASLDGDADRLVYFYVDNGENYLCVHFNASPSGQNGRHFTDDIFKCVFLNEKFCILIQISQKFVPKSPIDNKWALDQVIAWCWIRDKPYHLANVTQ